MSIRFKIILVLVLTMPVLVAGVYMISKPIVMNSHIEYERFVITESVHRVNEVIGEELDHMSNTNVDWGSWEETKQFVLGNNPDYVSENMMDSTLTNLGLNMMVFVDSRGKIVYAKAVDLGTGTQSDLPPEFGVFLNVSGPIISVSREDSLMKGLVLLFEGPMFITARPILDSNGEGPSAGTLILGRWLDEDMIGNLAKVSRTEVAVKTWSGSEAPKGNMITAPGVPKKISIQELSQETIRGSLSLANIHGTGGIVLEVDMPRTIYNKGKQTIAYFTVALAMISFLFIVAVGFLLEFFVTRRVGELHRAVGKVAKSSKQDVRISLPGNDEVAGLAGSINSMLEELYHSEKALGLVVGATQLPMIALNRYGVVRAWNRQAEEILGWNADEAVGRSDLIVKEDSRLDLNQFAEFAATTQGVLTLECEAVSKDGSTFEAMLIAGSTGTGSEEEKGAIMVLLDITGRKEAERALKNALAIKDTLLCEVHHRIKNNLQAVSSVLDLGALKSDSPEAKQVIWEGQSRINAMALVHEKLYQSDDPERVDLKPYVEDLVRNIASTFSREGTSIDLKVDVQDLKFNSETAVSCGFMINELITNSYKYAFPHDRDGNVLVKLSEPEAGLYKLTVSDDGVGLCQDIAPENMGLRMVRSIATQLDGSFDVSSNGGTRITVEFRSAPEMVMNL